MNAEKAEVGKKYLSKTGVPIVVVGAKGDKILVKLLTTGNQVDVPKDYELQPYDEKKITSIARVHLRTNGKGAKGSKQKTESLAALIDPYLISGGHTVKEIVAELAKNAGDLGKNKDLGANCRARMVSFKRKGWQVLKDDKKRVKVTQIIRGRHGPDSEHTGSKVNCNLCKEGDGGKR
ncbi:MAG: hypothetical protein HYT79_02685 [Elusimicrobia bacterium]|nr:hypothetical protein [Elusimicrobiota bacterium]